MAGKRALERDQTNGMFRARQLSKIAHLAMFPNSCSTLESLAFDSRAEGRITIYGCIALQTLHSFRATGPKAKSRKNSTQGICVTKL